MSAPPEIRRLVDLFERHIDEYKDVRFKEAQLRSQFLDPFLEALGWDMRNKQEHSEAYKEVIFEDAIRIGDALKAPDYCMRIGKERKFFVEAKKPSVDVKDEPAAAYQLRRYAWTAKLPLGILTDFEELAVYDCRHRPKKNDKSATARIKLYSYKDFVEHWDEIASRFSREAVAGGSFNRFVTDAGRRGVEEVDHEFLEEIEEWRKLLATNIANRNRSRSQREINYAVQQTIDRIIFLRICEDRSIEQYGQLLSLLNAPHIYDRLKEIFRKADKRYNSGLFHFHEEKDVVEAPDTVTPTIKIDDDVLATILKRLYYPDSPYAFAVLSPEILGQVYEQFLGKVIRITEGHHAKIDEKPEVRKAGGVYYTPRYIVEYIVSRTVGKLVDGKTLKQVADLKIVDPACGSGSFLLGAYQYLLDWHFTYYTKQPEKWKKELYRCPHGDWHLTTTERKRILLCNIYGVDIDAQAVEVTKLSLLLKVLEGEMDEYFQQQLFTESERVLPDLGKNIRCGNSLIGTDFSDGAQQGLFQMGEEEQLRINVFDWQSGFPDVFNRKNPGFDAVIGNPPYIRIQEMQDSAPESIPYYAKTYGAAQKGNYDIYVIFAEKGLQLLNPHGVLGYILPHKFFNAKYGEPLRKIISDGKHLAHVVHFGDQQVFSGATTYTCLMFLTKTANKDCEFVKVEDLNSWRQKNDAAERGKIPAKNVTEKEWNFVAGKGGELFERLGKMPIKLEDATTRIFQGLKTSADKIYIVEARKRVSGNVVIFSPMKEWEYVLEPDLLHSLVKGGDSHAYHLSTTERLILFPYKDGVLIPQAVLQKQYPFTWNYLCENKKYLEEREDGMLKGENWYAFGRTQALDVISLPKIFIPDIAPKASFSFDASGSSFFTGGVAGGYGILAKNPFTPKYLLALLNSRLLDWYLKKIATQMRGNYFSFESRFIKQLPIRTIDFSNPKEKSAHDRIVTLVDRMLEFHNRLPAAKTPHDIDHLQRQIAATDREIDEIVYGLYGVTEEERKIVEGAAGR